MKSSVVPRFRRCATAALWFLSVLTLVGRPLAATQTVSAAKKPVPPPDSQTGQQALQSLIAYANQHRDISPLMPGRYDARITRLVAELLQGFQYSRHPLDQEMAGRWLHLYIESLDPLRLQFLQSDIKEFQRFQKELPDDTLGEGKTLAAREIFARFMQRLEERVEYVSHLLQTNHFTFTGNDRYAPDRKNAPWPADLAAAHKLWKESLRLEYLEELLNKQKPDQILKTLANRYKRTLQSWCEVDSSDVLQLYLTALANSYDPHSDYMGKAAMENFAISMKLSLFGIGALLRWDDGYCRIESLVANGPAARSKKIRPGDRIIAVQQKGKPRVDVVGMKLTKIVDMIRGPKGTEVTLTLIPAGATDSSERKVVSLVRAEITLKDQEAKAKLIELPNDAGKETRVGVIDLPSFYASFNLGESKQKAKPHSASADVARLIKKLEQEGAKGIILDLRHNGGGSLEEAIKLTGLFIKPGPVVQVRDTTGAVVVDSAHDHAPLYTGPLIVLTSRFSASASEIVAAALQDYGRALIVGDRTTHGKGTVQTIFELNRFVGRFPPNFNPGALKMTIRTFYRINGKSTQLDGVTPNIILPSVDNYLDVGEASLEYPLHCKPIAPVKYKPLDDVKPYVAELRRRSKARQATNEEFTFIHQDIKEYLKQKAEKTVSLNEKVRLREKKEADQRLKKREAERLAHGQSKEKIYDITLKLAGEPGLPKPLSEQADAKKELAQAAAMLGSDDTTQTNSDNSPPPPDVTLDETQNILLDLISLSSSRKTISTVATKN